MSAEEKNRSRDASGPPGGTATGPEVRQHDPLPEGVRALSGMAEPDYADLFVMTGGRAGRSPEQWARLLFEDAAGRGGQLLWRGLLGLRLKAAPERIAGWRVAARGADWVRIEARSWFLTVHLVVQADDAQVALATFLRYDRLPGRLIWTPLSKKHREAAPGLFREANEGRTAPFR